jgi:hypothetical protein
MRAAQQIDRICMANSLPEFDHAAGRASNVPARGENDH